MSLYFNVIGHTNLHVITSNLFLDYIVGIFNSLTFLYN